MEQLIKFHQNKLDKDCQHEINKEEKSYSKNIQTLQENCNDIKSYIEKRMIDTYNELKAKYEEYLQDNTKNVISIQGRYYDRTNPEYYNNVNCDKYRERTLGNWMQYNPYEMDIINLFLKELPSNVRYSLSLNPYEKHARIGFDHILRYEYTGGEELLITLTKLD